MTANKLAQRFFQIKKKKKLAKALTVDSASLNQQDLTALAKELRAVDDVRPPNKVTDYSSSSEESDTTDEDDDEEVDQEAGEESTSGPEDTRALYVQWSNS